MTKETIQFEFLHTQDYCGGAYPPEELLEELKTPSPYSGTLYVHQNKDRSDKGIQLQFVEGKVAQEGFVEGTYYMFLYPKYTPSEIESSPVSPSDGPTPECFEKRSLTVLTSFEISRESTEIKKTIHIACDPCGLPRP